MKCVRQRAGAGAAAGARARLAHGRAGRAGRAPAAAGAGAGRRRAGAGRASSPPTRASRRAWWPTAGRASAARRRRRGRDARREGFREWGARRPPRSAPRRWWRAAAALRERRLELAALMVRECAKPWAEADADVCEAIDFLEYYARAARRSSDAGAALLQVPGRAQHHALRAARRGGGDLAVELPARDRHRHDRRRRWRRATRWCSSRPSSPRPARSRWCEALHGRRRAAEALSLLPGFGEAGAALVRDPRVHTIAFTGSGAVGPRDRAGRGRDPRRAGPREARGGRDGRQELRDRRLRRRPRRGGARDGALRLRLRGPEVLGRRARARARGGRTTGCAERLAGAVEVLDVGQAERFATDVPPVIDARGPGARARLRGRGGASGTDRGPRRARPAAGWFCPPTLASGLDPDARVLREEVFGPLLTVEPVGVGRGGLRHRRLAARSRSPAGCSPAARRRSRRSPRARRSATST